MERKIIITNIQILKATIKSKLILMIIPINLHHILSKIIQEIVIFSLCNNLKHMMIIPVTQTKILVKVQQLKQKLQS